MKYLLVLLLLIPSLSFSAKFGLPNLPDSYYENNKKDNKFLFCPYTDNGEMKDYSMAIEITNAPQDKQFIYYEYSIQGDELSAYQMTYTKNLSYYFLDRRNSDDYFVLRRDNLKLFAGFEFPDNFRGTCRLLNSREEIIEKFENFIKERMSKNKI